MRHNAKFLAAALVLLAFTSALDQPAGTKLWEFYTGHSIQSSPALGADGTVYFGADNGNLYAFDPQGSGKWEFPTGDALVASPAVAADGTVIIGSVDGNLYAVGADGVEKWRFRSNGKIVSSPALGASNSVFFGTMQKTLYAVNGEGMKRWELELEDAVVSSPAVGRDGTIYVASLNGVLYAVDFWGKVKWKFKASEKVNASPAIGPDGTIYFGAFDGHVYAIKPNGQKKWTFATGAAVRGSPSVGPDGVVYVGSDDRKLYAFAPDGFKLWSYTPGGWVRSTPAVSSDGTIYVGSYDNSLHAVSTAGVKAWEFATDSAISSSPALSANGVVYFGGWNKRFYAVKGGAGLAPNVWAKFRGDARQTAALSESSPMQFAAPAVRPAFPVQDTKPLAITDKGAAAEEFARAQAARELAMAAKKDSVARAKAAAVPPPVAPKPPKMPDPSVEAKRLAKAQAEADAKAARDAKALRIAEQRAEADANTKMLADNARVLKEAELARKAQEQEDYRRALSAAELARLAKKEADQRAQAGAQAQLAESRLVIEDGKRVLKEAEEARKQQAIEEAQSARNSAELARIAKQEAEQRETAKRAADLAEAKRSLAESQAAEAAKRKADADAALQAKAQADADRRAAMEIARKTKLQQDAERKAQETAAARELAEAKAKAELEAKAAAEAARMSAKEQEIARKVQADSEKAAREEADRQARAAALEQAAERRRIEAERQKWEPVSGGFFRRLFGGGSSEPKVKSEAPAAPAVAAPVAPEPQAVVSIPTPPPVAPVPVVTMPVVPAPVVPPPPAVTAPVVAAPSVPLKYISDSAELVRPAAPVPPPTSFFTPAQPTVDPLAEQIELIKQRAAMVQAQPQQPQFVQPVPQAAVPQFAVPQVAQPVAETPAEPQAREEKSGFWSRVGGFFVRSKKDQQAQQGQPQTAQQPRPAAQWPPNNIVVRDPRSAAPGALNATNFPRVQYAPVTNQNNLFLPRAIAMQTNMTGMPQMPAPPREVREMRPGKTAQQGITELQGPSMEVIAGRVRAVLRVYATGAGKVIPDLNGAELEVGQTYTVEAQPARGAAFVGWTGSIESTSPVLRFVMRTGTILSANFQFGYNMERELPEVAITAPDDGTRLTSPVFTLQGAARDNVSVARVEVSVDNGPWEPAQGTDTWMFQSAAQPGPNTVRVRAVDQAGNASQPLQRTLHYPVGSVLTVRMNGAGTVTPDGHGRLLDVGVAYEVRATPAAGHVFTGWSGGVSGVSPSLQFTMQPNLVIEANFAPRVASLSRGVFNGLVYPTNSLAPSRCGFFQLEIAADGGFTGSLRQGVASHAMSGQFDLNGQATTTVARAGLSPLTVSLQLDTVAGERLMGRFNDDGQGVEMFAYRQVYDGRTSVTPLAGRYTFVMPMATNSPTSPGGDAFGEIVVDGAGNVRFSGELPDGTLVRHEAVMGRNGLWPLHVPLSGGRGMLLGWITVSKDPGLDAFGEVIWHKPLSPQDRYYPNGFSTRRHLFGNLYTPGVGGAVRGDQRIGGMLNGGNLDKVVLGDSGLPMTAGMPGHQVLQHFAWNFRPDTGYVEGTFIHPATKQETAFRGALLQKRGWTSGYFLGQSQSGVVHLQLPQ